MRRVLLSDIVHLATALSAQPIARPEEVLDRWLDQTHAAAKYARRFRCPHPTWGDGSLTSRALKSMDGQTPPKPAEGAEFFGLLALVAGRLARIGQSRS